VIQSGGSRFSTSSFFPKGNFRKVKKNGVGKGLTMNRKQVPGAILTFAVGAGIGAAVALLFAPKSGEELRGDIADGVNDGVNQVRSTSRDLKRRAQRVVDMAKDQVQDAIEAGDTAYNQAKRA
jgi:YtxH-like protein